MRGFSRDAVFFVQAFTLGTAAQLAQHAQFHVGTLAAKSYATRPEAAPPPSPTPTPSPDRI